MHSTAMQKMPPQAVHVFGRAGPYVLKTDSPQHWSKTLIRQGEKDALFVSERQNVEATPVITR